MVKKKLFPNFFFGAFFNFVYSSPQPPWGRFTGGDLKQEPPGICILRFSGQKAQKRETGVGALFAVLLLFPGKGGEKGQNFPPKKIWGHIFSGIFWVGFPGRFFFGVFRGLKNLFQGKKNRDFFKG